ncbi:hypothetical protein [Streptomyces coffeae]|uniref:Uncharacterized protein n=1 Tax=Streptomyces coffeae TaxID=621382 RepID=A0ABS1NA16_9ACTN|nr:hypothetical protein [Streptomyces coffeae]MBL1096919.1 hypothetical protein [Streptomyces coffeae]
MIGRDELLVRGREQLARGGRRRGVGALPASQRTVLDAALTGRQSPSEQHGGLALRLAVCRCSGRRPSGDRCWWWPADDLQWMGDRLDEARTAGGALVRIAEGGAPS